jgi:nitrile hydratase accessory protein
MTRSEPESIPELDTPLLRRPRDDAGPVFRAPWEAQAFAIALSLHEGGVFTWQEWADTLAIAIRDAQAAGDADLGESYYVHWLTALERICSSKRLVNSAMLVQRRLAWEAAARRTPHGKPVLLKSDAG